MTGIYVLDKITVFRLNYTLLSHLTKYTKIQKLGTLIRNISNLLVPGITTSS
jgi:hypothetical protein